MKNWCPVRPSYPPDGTFQQCLSAPVGGMVESATLRLDLTVNARGAFGDLQYLSAEFNLNPAQTHLPVMFVRT